MSHYIKKYIITGAPGTGKTSLINALKAEHPCMDEVSRSVIREEQEKGGNGMPWDDIDRFVALVYDVSVRELAASPSACFTDRSILDLIAYLDLAGKSVPAKLEDFPYLEKFRKKVFFAPTWPTIYHKDAQRLQAFEYCVELAKALENCYIKKGFEIIKLPRDTVAIRANFVNTFMKTQTTPHNI